MNTKMFEEAQTMAGVAEEIRQAMLNETEPEAIETLQRRYEEAFSEAHDAIIEAAEAVETT